MEVAMKQIVMIIIGIVLATLIILFVLGKIGVEGSITETILSLLDTAGEGI
jgi:cell division protein FtsB